MWCGSPKLIAVLAVIACASGCSYLSNHKANQTIQELESIGSGRFSSQEEFVAYFNKTASVRDHIERRRKKTTGCPKGEICLEEVAVTAQKASSNPVITNNQEAGVDEGGIVKVIGNHFIILRQGKLYSVRMASGAESLTPMDAIDVIKPGWEHDGWIDELLVYKNTIVVIGYTYQSTFLEGTTELNILQLAEDGTFTHKNTYVIHSADYFSSENYATRIIDGELIFNFPVPLYELPLQEYGGGFEFARIGRLPDTPQTEIAWSGLLAVEDIYKPVEATVYPVLHVFVKCTLETHLKDCRSAGVISSQFEVPSYVTTESIYFATQSLRAEYLIDAEFDYSIEGVFEHSKFRLYRIGLDQLNVESIGIKGIPLNQFSFHETGDKLRLLTGWKQNSETTEFYLHTISLEEFSEAGVSQSEPKLIGEFNSDNWYVTRFVGDWLAIGQIHDYWDKDGDISHTLGLYNTHNLRSVEIPLSHSSDRLELAGSALFVMGYREGAELTASLISTGDSPQSLSSYEFSGIHEGEHRSHAFNFTQHFPEQGILGFTAQWKQGHEKTKNYTYYGNRPSDIVYMGIDQSFQMRPLATLQSNQAPDENHQSCSVSCYDWYGNTRPFFLNGKIYGLTGSELIQAGFTQGEIIEEMRVDYRSINN